MQADDLLTASHRLQASMLRDEDVPGALSLFAEAAGADSGLLISETAGLPNRILEAPPLAAMVATYLAGDAPFDPREQRVQLGPSRGFAADLEDFTLEEIARDPFYQEFLRLHDVAWNACAWLGRDRSGGDVVLSLKRSARQGQFDREDTAALDRLLTGLRVAVALRRELGPWRQGIADEILERPGRGVAWLGAGGELLAPGMSFVAEVAGILDLAGGRLTASLEGQQHRLDAAIARASGPPGEAAAVIVHDRTGRRLLIRFLPVQLPVAEFLEGGAMLASASRLRSQTEPSSHLTGLVAQAFGLTLSEARVATLIACGWPMGACADRLRISTGTARNHLKAAFAKTGVSRQVELATLLAPLISV